MMSPVVWSIAGSDSSGYAGIQADLKTFHGLGVHGCTVITAVTAQNNSQLSDIQFIDIEPQLAALKTSLYPAAIKIGMLGDTSVIDSVRDFLKQYSGTVILDPVLITTSGGHLFKDNLENYTAHLKSIFYYVDVLTPNIPEAEKLLNCRIHSCEDIVLAARELLKLGMKSVLIKGGHFNQTGISQDYWTNGKESYWFASPRHEGRNVSGTGCTFSSALAAACALGYEIKDALMIAKMYVNQLIRVGHGSWPVHEVDLPCAARDPFIIIPDYAGNHHSEQFGLYPIIDSLDWLKCLLPLGVKTIQLRIKNKSGIALEQDIQEAVKLAKQYHVRLFINDYWRLAIQYGAYGVHLGQEDLATADIEQIRAAGLRLGISTHGYFEVACAHTYRPTYLAIGPIFHTTTKMMAVAPQGVHNLKRWRRLLSYPLIAIGGINLSNITSVLETNADGIALISAITKAEDPIGATTALLARVNAYATCG